MNRFMADSQDPQQAPLRPAFTEDASGFRQGSAGQAGFAGQAIAGSAATQGTAAAGVVLPPLPALPASGEEIYDALMGQIEPELTTAEQLLLEEKYKDEPPGQRVARLERYRKAFEEYDRHYAAYMRQMESSVQRYRHTLQTSVEQAAKQDDATAMRSLEGQISAL